MSVDVDRADLFDLAAALGTVGRLDWAVAREMLAAGDAFAARNGGELVAVAGLYPLPAGGFELWFQPLPAARRHMGALLSAVRLTLSAGAYRGVVTICASESGRRMARLAGFTFVQDSELGEIWTWLNS